MKNYFCVGQKVIILETRQTATVETLAENGLGLDNGSLVFLDEVQALEQYLDPTNYFYHHSMFGEAVQQINDHFNDFLYWTHEKENETIDAVIRGIENRIQLAESNLEKWLMIKRTAEHNLAQWSSGEVYHVIGQHMRFL